MFFPLKLWLWSETIRCHSAGEKRIQLLSHILTGCHSLLLQPGEGTDAATKNFANSLLLLHSITKAGYFFSFLGLWVFAHTATAVLILLHSALPLHQALFWRYQNTESGAGSATSTWWQKVGSEAGALHLQALHLPTASAENDLEKNAEKKYRDGAEAEIIAKVRRFKWSREYKSW